MPHPSSAVFWSLIDRWRVSDEQALELISYEGKLPTTERRPRFRLSAEQARTVSTMLEVDSALAAAGIDLAWLHRQSGAGGSTGQDVADIHPRRLHEPVRWVVGAKTGTGATVPAAQKRAEEAYMAQTQLSHEADRRAARRMSRGSR